MKEKEDSFEQISLDVGGVVNAAAADDPAPSEPAPETDARTANGEQLTMDDYPAYRKAVKPKKKFSERKSVFYIAFAVICAASIALTAYMDFSDGELMAARDILRLVGKNWYYMLLAIVALAFVFLCEGLRTSLTLYGSTGKFEFRLGMSTAAITKCYDYITPLGAGGQPFAIVYMSKRGVPGGKATASVLSSYFLQQIVYVVLAIIALACCSFVNINLAQIIMAIVGAVCCFFVPFAIITFALLPKASSKMAAGCINFLAKLKIVKHPEKIIEKAIGGVKSNADSIKQIARNGLVFWLSVLLSVGGWCAHCSIAYFSLRAFGFDLPENGFVEWLRIVQMCLILYISVSFIPTPGNAGASELSFYFIFTENLAAGVGFTALIIWRFLSYYSFIIIGLIVEIRSNFREKRKARLKGAD